MLGSSDGRDIFTNFSTKALATTLQSIGKLFVDINCLAAVSMCAFSTVSKKSSVFFMLYLDTFPYDEQLTKNFS